MAATAGERMRDERMRRHWTVRELAARAGISPAHLSQLEGGEPGSLEVYARVMTALDLRPELAGLDPRDRGASTRRDQDFVHAAMGELQAGRLREAGFEVAIDEPYQHYQFAGRADVVAWDRAARALLHIENRTRFPNVQEALGSYAAKRAYLGRVLAERLGIDRRGWSSETHVIAALRSSEVLHALRLRETTFRVACGDPIDCFRAWWRGDAAALRGDAAALRGTSSSIAVFDAAPGVRERYRFTSFDEALTARPRYRDYADAARHLRGDVA